MLGIFRKLFSKSAKKELSEEEAQKLDADPWNAQLVAALARSYRKDSKPLIEHVRQRATADPHNFLIPLGRLYALVDKPTLAILQYRKFLQTPKGPHHEGATEELAKLLERIGKPDEARKLRK